MITTAQRNRIIKTTLEKEYGKGKVWVRGSRGTAYGWVDVFVDIEISSVQWASERQKIRKLLDDAKVEIGTYGYDDPGSDYGYGSKINYTFNRPYGVAARNVAA
jgi:hypothetical protein